MDLTNSPNNQTASENGVIKLNKKPTSPLLVLAIILGVISIFVSLFFAIMAVVSTVSEEPLRASNEFLEALVSSDPQKAYDMASSDFKLTASVEDFEKLVENNDFAPLNEAKVISKRVETNNFVEMATFGYEIEYNSIRYTFETKVIKEDGEWKILGLNIK